MVNFTLMVSITNMTNIIFIIIIIGIDGKAGPINMYYSSLYPPK